MQDKYYGFDTYDRDIIDNADYIIDRAENDPEFMAENFDTYRAAMEIQMAAERRVRLAEIEKRRLNQHHAQKLKFGKFKGLVLGAALGISALVAAEQLKGTDVLANAVYETMEDNGYGWRDDSQTGIIFNQYDSFVDYDTAINNIRHKCEELGMTDAQIDVGLNAILHIKPENSSLNDRIVARNDAYHESKVENKGMGK